MNEIMRSFTQNTHCYLLWKRIIKAQFVFLLVCFSFSIFLFWAQPVSGLVSEHAVSNYRQPERQTDRHSKQLKYILLWTGNRNFQSHHSMNAQSFINLNRLAVNCFVTRNRKLFRGDLTKFDAIVYNENKLSQEDLPKHRSPHQKYIFFNKESAHNHPVCSQIFDGFFNWTFTYRIDSDIPSPYFVVKDRQKITIGPKAKMYWQDKLPDVSKDFTESLMNKTKAVAWFVSNCRTRSRREYFVDKLQDKLARYGYNVDICGQCGLTRCSKNCYSKLKDYFFYLALENSFADDYVTEKLLTALQYDTVPIVYGGADYSRFLPPGSYLNARHFKVDELAAIIVRLMKSPEIYSQFFRWKGQYTYRKANTQVSEICAALGNKEMAEKVTVYYEFRRWWYPDFMKECKSLANSTKKVSIDSKQFACPWCNAKYIKNLRKMAFRHFGLNISGTRGFGEYAKF